MTTSTSITGLDQSGEPGKGFAFPGVFEITALGPATAQLDTEIPRLLVAAGLSVLHETVSLRGSSAGRFVSVTISFRAETRADYDAAHEALRAHPEVKWTL
jgi:putative lipoic acid-binding regulatory protein